MDWRDIKNFFDDQLDCWDLARLNYQALEKVKTKSFKTGRLEGVVQFNPARSVSTLANVDKESIKQRNCFLCKTHRPKEQKGIELIQGWELLVNPFPILPYHFTIAGKEHKPQILDIKTGIELASNLPGMVVFFNDDGAGASAPDHVHFQAVPINALPLIQSLEKDFEIKDNDFPFHIEIRGYDEKSTNPVNAFFWKKETGAEVRWITIPRKAHRPSSYYLMPPFRRAISPGAIDMGGVLVTPIEEDFNRTELSDIERIYQEVGI